MPPPPSILRPPRREQDAPRPSPVFSSSGIRPAEAPALASAPPSPEVARFGAKSAVARPVTSLAEFDDDVDTGVTLTPALLAAIRSVAPARRRSKLPYVIAVGLVAAYAA